MFNLSNKKVRVSGMHMPNFNGEMYIFNSELVTYTVKPDKQASADGNSFELPPICIFEKLSFGDTSLLMKVSLRTRSDLEIEDT